MEAFFLAAFPRSADASVRGETGRQPKHATVQAMEVDLETGEE